MGGASAQTEGPSGNIDVPDISQASSNDLHDEVGWGLDLLLPPSSSFLLSFVEMTTQVSLCHSDPAVTVYDVD